MNKLIVIDDEPLALEQLQTVLDWEKIGYQLVGAFSDGKSAIEYIQHHQVNTVLTDIKMPRVSGLDIARLCYEQYPDICVVIISAYRDFEYARTAMQYNVADFITKPISYKDLYQTMMKVAARVSDDAPQRGFLDHEVQAGWEMVFSNLVCELYPDVAAFKKALAEHDIFIDPEAPCAIINIHINEYETYLNHVWKHGRFRLYNAISQLVPFHTKNAYFVQIRYASNNVEFIGICQNNPEAFAQETERFMRDLKQNLRDILSLDADISVIREFQSLSSIIRSEVIDTPVTENTVQNNVIGEALSYINQNYDKPLTLEVVAKHVNISPMYFSAYFKQHVKENFLNYLTAYRMEKARKLLENKDIKISSVCHMLGYKNASHFYTIFKAYNNGMTPAQYRDALKQKGEMQ